MIARISLWAREKSCKITPPRQSRSMVTLYLIPACIIDMVRGGWILLLDDYRTDC